MAESQYRVLARKYRPQDFDGLIGQDAMVRTLTNAMESGRLAHAFILTGVRGTGKTTTARIIARALNCEHGPTIKPCGTCPQCTAIADDRHVDVLEMDAASRTGVNDIRDILDGVRYRPTDARYKIYIIDEVHMLSQGAFNALLKTLEEPPGHVKFIFATTEIRKVPVTVLSRCHRFDLRRVDQATLAGHFRRVLANEGEDADDAALNLIARAADGSVRDGLSLLDQALADRPAGDAPVREQEVRDMLGLADRTGMFDLLDALMKGDAAAVLDQVGEHYQYGGDPEVVLHDLLNVVHWLTRIRVAPSLLEDPALAELDRERGRSMAEALGMAVLSRTWQMLLKGLEDVRTAPNPVQALEMVLLRVAYAADLPPPAEAVQQATGRSQSPPPGGGGGGAPAPSGGGTRAAQQQAAPQPAPGDAPRAQAAPEPSPATLADVVALLQRQKEPRLAAHLRNDVHPVACEPGRLELMPTERAPRDLVNRLGGLLTEATGQRWMVTVTDQENPHPTLADQERQAEEARVADATAHPLVQAVLQAFPDARVAAVRDRPGAESDDAAAGAPAVEDGLDPEAGPLDPGADDPDTD